MSGKNHNAAWDREKSQHGLGSGKVITRARVGKSHNTAWDREKWQHGLGSGKVITRARVGKKSQRGLGNTGVVGSVGCCWTIFWSCIAGAFSKFTIFENRIFLETMWHDAINESLSTGVGSQKKGLGKSEMNNENTKITYSQVRADAEFIKIISNFPRTLADQKTWFAHFCVFCRESYFIRLVRGSLHHSENDLTLSRRSHSLHQKSIDIGEINRLCMEILSSLCGPFWNISDLTSGARVLGADEFHGFKTSNTQKLWFYGMGWGTTGPQKLKIHWAQGSIGLIGATSED